MKRPSLWGCLKSILPATKSDLEKIGTKIMSAISDFANAQNIFNDQLDAAVEGLIGDVKFLKDEIERLQNSGGQVTPEDQALLDSIQARTKIVADKLTALDSQTPPPVPTP